MGALPGRVGGGDLEVLEALLAYPYRPSPSTHTAVLRTAWEPVAAGGSRQRAANHGPEAHALAVDAAVEGYRDRLERLAYAVDHGGLGQQMGSNRPADKPKEARENRG